MTRITQIEDRGAVVAWSPIASHADVIALGAKDSGGIGFDNYGGELEVYDLNFTGSDASRPKPHVLGSVKTTSRFSSIGWTPGVGKVADRFRMGLIAGGMLDGTVHVWNPKAMTTNQDPLVASVRRHSGGAVSGLQFNPHPASANLLATGGSNGEIFITSLDKPSEPHVYVPSPDRPSQNAEITQVAWNSQVAHIVASSARDGTVVVWDLKSKKPWCELRCETAGVAVSDLAWNPSQGLHVVTASADDRNPVLKLWDLRASTSMPLATLAGHSQGILSLSWCPHDDSLLVSCGKDNRTILWDLFTLQPIADIPNDDGMSASDAAAAGPSVASGVYSGGLSSSQQKRYDVKWSPLTRGVVSTCSFDRKVQAHSVIGLATKCGRPPKWLKPSSGVSCGFGGSVVSFAASDKIVKIKTVVEQPKLVEASNTFEAAIATNDVIGFCRSLVTKADKRGDAHESQVWSFMQIIFEANAREQLLGHLGFHKDAIAEAAMRYSEDPSNGVASMSLKDKPRASQMSRKAGETVKKALLVGNFEAAVECCFRTGNLADALVLASCGGSELWSKTQERYFSLEAKKRPFLSIVSAVIHDQLEDLVASSDTSRWQETLAILSTYGKSDQFPALCIALGDRLESNGDAPNASLCYMCALNLERAVKYWRSQLDKANKAKSSLDLLALHEFVVKVSVFLNAMEPSAALDPEIADLFSTYAKALSEQGLFVTAAKYSRGTSEESKVLRDRLYRSREHYNCASVLGTAPEFPFSLQDVKKAPAGASVGARTRQGQQVQQAANSQPSSVASATSKVQQQQSTQYTPTDSSGQLPAGWISLQDPASGGTYYANQTTGETTWEKPQPAPVVANSTNGTLYASTSAMQQQPLQHQSSQSRSNGASGTSTPMRMASKYGDGFVTSASHPELAQQYGNVGTSNPYTGAERPGTARATPNSNAPEFSGSYDPNQPPTLSAELQPVSDVLLQVVSSLSSGALTAADKRQLAEGEKAVGILLKKLSYGEIAADVSSQVITMTEAIRNRDYRTATAIQSGLANSVWKENKDWLRGLKFLIQLAWKKL